MGIADAKSGTPELTIGGASPGASGVASPPPAAAAPVPVPTLPELSVRECVLSRRCVWKPKAVGERGGAA